MKLIKNAVKGEQSKNTHGTYCELCGHYDEVHFRDTDCECVCHDKK